jgi:hypothetical protein
MRKSAQKPNRAWLDGGIRIPVEQEAVKRVARVLTIVREEFYAKGNAEYGDYDFWVRPSAQFIVYEAMRQKDDFPWIPVAHALPPRARRQAVEGLVHSEDVLATDGKHIYIGRTEEREGEPGTLTWMHSNGHACENVTHWTPLQKLPR